MTDEKKSIYDMPYPARLKNYNVEKRVALENCKTQEERDTAIRYLAKKWRV